MPLTLPLNLPLGPVMADVLGLRLTADDINRLCHPLVGAVVLFARNYQDPQQLRELTAEIHALRSPALLIAVDHEGGRVQRFRDGFTTIPPMRTLGERWCQDPTAARALAHDVGTVIGRELADHGVDFSFAPVLDLDWGESGIIGHRAFSRDPQVVATLAVELIAGLHDAGMASCGKHFPGHGWVRADSHLEVPVDTRALEEVLAVDALPFKLLNRALDSVMPAHVIYPAADAAPAGFSAFWLQDVLRKQNGFEGVIFSDDLTMEGAAVAGGVVERAAAAFAAGCDMVLLCNDPARCDELLAGLSAKGVSANVAQSQHLGRMRAQPLALAPAADPAYLAARARVQALSA